MHGESTPPATVHPSGADRPTGSTRALAAATLLACAVLGSCGRAGSGDPPADVDWPITGGNAENTRYSPLAAIDRDNVHQLRVAWTYHTGGDPGQIQATPIVVDGVLYATSPSVEVFALRGDTGEELWRFDPVAAGGTTSGVNRGVVYWAAGDDRRILFTAGRRIWALDASDGSPIQDFGDGGWVDLAEGLGLEVQNQSLLATSPGVIHGSLLIQGTRVGEGQGALPGHIRAFDVRSGAVRWVFHTIPQPGTFGADSWAEGSIARAGGANSWAGMAVDREREIVYVPTGSATPDFWGGDRVGANLFANSLVALDARTGERLWHFQTVHHDLWDRDLPAAPNLVTVRRNGRSVDAVAQITKSGFVFLFDRATGSPLFPIEERPVPVSTLPGETAWPTQPFPVSPAPFARQRFAEEDVTTRTPEAHAAVLERYRTLYSPATLFTPPSLEGTIILPGFDGGGEWGGAAVDPAGVIYVNGGDVPWIARMEPITRVGDPAQLATRSGASIYAAECATCHGAEREGDGGRSPALTSLAGRMSAGQIRTIIEEGRGFMPGMPGLTPAERNAVTVYLLGDARSPAAPVDPVAGVEQVAEPVRPPYRFTGYERWTDPDGFPAIEPPWGTLNAIDLNSGEYLWKIPLGEHPDLPGSGLQPTGTEQYGGPIVTAGGVLFIAATMDAKIRAFDSATGDLLWEAPLPAAGYATPATYMVDGRQFIVIAAGGGKLGTPPGDAYVAFALPIPNDPGTDPR